MRPGELAPLVAAALPDEGLAADDLERCCAGAEVLGDDRGAAVIRITHTGGFTSAWLLLLAVAPASQRRGIGRALLGTAVERARAAGAADLHVGNAAPRYVWPGVDFAFTAALALFEACGFEPNGAGFNMGIATSFRAEPPSGVTIERETGAGAAGLAERAYPHWVDETTRSVEHGTCFAARAGGETIAFACHSANRRGWIGPMASDPARQRGGVGRALLGAVCADLATEGLATADIAWVGPVGFYAKCGARVSRVFRTARLPLSTP